MEIICVGQSLRVASYVGFVSFLMFVAVREWLLLLCGVVQVAGILQVPLSTTTINVYLLLNELGTLGLVHCLLLIVGEIVQAGGQGGAVGETGLGVHELVEEGVAEGLERMDTILGDVLEELSDKVMGLDGDVLGEHGAPWLALDILKGLVAAVELL